MRIPLILLTTSLLAAGCASKHKSTASKDTANTGSSFQETFDVDKSDLSPRGMSQYIILMPGRRAEYQSRDGKLIITVLPQTKTIDGVQTAIVEERESENGKLKEVSRNFFAINNKTGDLYYFGEEVDEYKNGQITGHEGAWLSGQNSAHFGLLLPGQPKVGQKYYAEMAENAKDRCEIKDTNANVTTPLLGTFTHCIKIDETSPIEKGISHKVYAPNVGLIEDDEMTLVRVEGGSLE